MTPYSQHVGSKQNEPPHLRTAGTSGSLGAGALLSVGLHGLLIAFVIFGLPIFWEPEPLPGAIGIELAQLSDITAAPKVQKEGKPNNQPPQQEVQKEEPKKETPPPPPAPAPAAAPPPPPPPQEEVAEAIPDPAAEKQKEADKKKEEEAKKKAEDEKKKKEQEKKKKEDQKKQQKKDDAALDKLLANVIDQKPAPEPDQKPAKKKAEAAPAELSTGPQTEQVSEIPLTASEEDGIRGQIERNWNLGSLAGAPDLTGMVVELRITLQPDGTVTRAEVVNTGSSPLFRQASESAIRAVMVSSPLKLPAGKTYDSMVVRFHPDQVVQ